MTLAMNPPRPLPIGLDNFEKVITGNYFYVDKTELIADLWKNQAEVTLFTRPRRFGKSLNLSMLQYFFENTGDEEMNRRNKALFSELAVMRAGTPVTGQMGRYPVISLSLKSAKQPDFSLALYCIREEIGREFKRHSRILPHLAEGEEKNRFLRIMNQEGSAEDFATSVLFLSQCLSRIYEEKTIILIDEYDVPLENAYFQGFYEGMAGVLRSLFESALKSNSQLQFAVVTGCLRISKESIFTGLNNLSVISILSNQYDEHFGFSQQEVDRLLQFYKLEDRREVVKEWYDGYRFGECQVYNPWSVVNYIAEAIAGKESFPKTYWSNTSSNSIVKDLVEHADLELRTEIENLIAGQSIEKQVHEDITYEDIHESEDNLWNFLLFTGYLKATGSRMEGTRQYLSLEIPNMEVKYIYENTITAWFDRKIRAADLSQFYSALENGDTERMEQILTEILSESISFYDYAENYYHGFLAGLLRGNGKYIVKSNRESGRGRPDLILRTPSVRGKAIILELKTADSLSDMEGRCQEALRQIEERGYRRDLEKEGFRQIDAYGICFWKKEAMVQRLP